MKTTAERDAPERQKDMRQERVSFFYSAARLNEWQELTHPLIHSVAYMHMRIDIERETAKRQPHVSFSPSPPLVGHHSVCIVLPEFGWLDPLSLKIGILFKLVPNIFEPPLTHPFVNSR
jgi:hypothetical protein